MTASILVVEDDDPVRLVMETLLVQAGHRVHAVADGQAAVTALGETSFDLVVTDVRMPGVDGMTLLGRVRVERPGTPVVVVTGHGDVAMAVEAMKRGASEFFLKPVARKDLLGAVERALGPPVPSDVRVPANLRPRLPQLAETDAPVLILGLSGVGKVTLARAVHERARPEDPFVVVDVPAITPSLFEATLFGHEPGAFSGATGDSAGILRSAGEGTVVLARIDGLALDLQAKLLRTLQEREVRPVGSTTAQPLRARIIATAAPDLSARVADGRFREDLYYRLAVLVVEIPPLRERGSELPDLLASLWPSDTPRPTVSREALEVWRSHPWPGNVTELTGLLHRIAALGLRTIDAPTARRLLSDLRTTPALDLDRERTRTEADVVRQALAACGGNKSEAARLLGISRGTLYNKLRADEDRD